MSNKIVIFGSSRSHGNTRNALNNIVDDELVLDLNDYNISPFDYEHKNVADDFIPLIEKIIEYQTIIIATPVYWYQMSTQHKIFFDRFSDLLTIRKDLGRRFCSKNLFVISSFGTSYPIGFEETFSQICEYLEMNYLGTSFIYSGTENQKFIKNNVEQIDKAKAILMVASKA